MGRFNEAGDVLVIPEGTVKSKNGRAASVNESRALKATTLGARKKESLIV
jgi:hypothetical protein